MKAYWMILVPGFGVLKALNKSFQPHQEPKHKCFNDPIHGHITLHPLLVKMVDTPQFQRLRNIKQLGAGYFVYPGASHNRFEHSVGTCHLAGKLVRHLQSNQPELKISKEDVLCVEIAGLCHDLGHGPFSHTFDHPFRKEAKKKIKQEERLKMMFDRLIEENDLKKDMVTHGLKDADITFIKELIDHTFPEQEERLKMMFDRLIEENHLKKDMVTYGLKDAVITFIKELIDHTFPEHEERSKMMLDRLIEENDLKKDMVTYGLKDADITFIKELIDPTIPEVGWDEEKMGRPEEKSFLYEIVSNKRNRVDVDKWDYFARDSYHLGIKNSFDHNRLILFTRVLYDRDIDEKNQEGDIVKKRRRAIGFRDKECKHVYEMFHTRCMLHRRAYQHPVTKAVEKMISDAFLRADEHMKFGNSSTPKRISQTFNDMEAFEQLTDNLLGEILAYKGDNEHMKSARGIVERIFKRDIYRKIESKKLKDSKEDEDNKWSDKEKKRFKEIVNSRNRKGNIDIKEEDYFINVKRFNYGKEKENPVDHCVFFTKEDPDKVTKIPPEDESLMLPQTFEDCQLDVYCRNPDKEKELKDCCEEWKKENDATKK